jgi:hypothetical protein
MARGGIRRKEDAGWVWCGGWQKRAEAFRRVRGREEASRDRLLPRARGVPRPSICSYPNPILEESFPSLPFTSSTLHVALFREIILLRSYVRGSIRSWDRNIIWEEFEGVREGGWKIRFVFRGPFRQGIVAAACVWTPVLVSGRCRITTNGRDEGGHVAGRFSIVRLTPPLPLEIPLQSVKLHICMYTFTYVRTSAETCYGQTSLQRSTSLWDLNVRDINLFLRPTSGGVHPRGRGFRAWIRDHLDEIYVT